MKRLLGLLGLTCLVVLTACFYLGDLAALVLGGVSACLFFMSLFIRKTRTKKTLPVLFMTIVFAVSLFTGYTNLYITPLKDRYDGKTVSVKARQVSEDYYSYGYYCYELRCLEINGEKADCKLLLRSKDAIYTDVCDELQFTSELSFSRSSVSPSEKIFLQSWVSYDHPITVTKTENRNLNYYISALRHSLNNALYLEMDYDTANFASAVLLGNKHTLEPEVKSLLRTTGLSHISVVSGLHLSVIGTLLVKSFRLLFKNKYVSLSFSVAGAVVFAVLSGLGPSVVRALIMFVICSIGTMFGRKSDSVNSIGAAALVLTLPNPYSVGDIGMLLSFSATLGIVLWFPKVFAGIMNKVEKIHFLVSTKWIYKSLKCLISAFSCSLCATLWILPVSVVVFKAFSLVSLIANVFVVPFMTAVLFCIVFCVLTHYVGFLAVLTDALAQVVSWFYDYMILICREFAELPFAYIYTTKPYFYIWIAVTICLVLLAYIIRKKPVRVLCVLLSLLVLFSLSSVYRYKNRDTLTLHVPYTGSGVSVVLESSDGYAVLSAYGSSFHIDDVSYIAETIYAPNNNVLVCLPGYNSEKYVANLINEFDYSAVLRYDNKVSEPLCKDEIVFTDNHYLNLWGRADVTLVPCGGKVFVYIDTVSTTVLIVPRYSDCSLLPDKYRSSDVVVSQGCVNNPKLLSFNTLIAPGDGVYDDESMGYLLSVADRVIRGDDIIYDI